MSYPNGIEVGTVALLINDADEILICNSNEGLGWILPGGHLEPGEWIVDCVNREVHEELGIEIDLIGRLPEVEVLTDERHLLIFPFIAKIKSGQDIQVDNIEFSAAEWVSFETAEQTMNKMYATAIPLLKKWLKD